MNLRPSFSEQNAGAMKKRKDRARMQCVAGELPEWDSFESGAGTRQVVLGQSQRTKARIHRSGSIDILVLEESDDEEGDGKHDRERSDTKSGALRDFVEDQEAKLRRTMEFERDRTRRKHKTHSDSNSSPPRKKNAGREFAEPREMDRLRRRDFDLDEEVAFWSARRARNRPFYVEVEQKKKEEPAVKDVDWAEHLSGIQTEFKSCIKRVTTTKEFVEDEPPHVRMRSLPDDVKGIQEIYTLWCTLDEGIYEISRFSSHLHEVNRETVASLRKSVRKAKDNVNSEKLSLKIDYMKRLDQTRDKITGEWAQKVSKLSGDLKEAREQLEQKETELKSLRMEKKMREELDARRTLEEENMQLVKDSERRELEKERARALHRCEAQIETLKHENALLEQERKEKVSTYKKQIAHLQAELIKMRDRMQIDKSAEMLKLKEQHENHCKAIEAKMRKLASDHNAYISELDSEFKERAGALRKEYNMQLDLARKKSADAEKKLEDTKLRHRDQLRRIVTQHKAKESAFEEEIRRLRQEMYDKKRSERERDPSPPPSPPPPPPPAQVHGEDEFSMQLEEYLNEAT